MVAQNPFSPSAQPTAAAPQTTVVNGNPTTLPLANPTNTQQEAQPPAATTHLNPKLFKGTCYVNDGTTNSAPFPCADLQPKSSKNTGAIAAAVIFALLFAALLGVLAFMIFRRRRNLASQPANVPLASYKQYDNSQDQRTIADLQAQIQSQNKRLNEFQGSLLAKRSNADGPWSTKPASDDRDVRRAFSQINNDFKDYASNFYRSGNAFAPHEVEPDLKKLLDGLIGGWENLLHENRTRSLLIRAVCGEILRHAWVEGRFLGDSIGNRFAALNNVVSSRNTHQQAQIWRLQTLRILVPASSNKTRAKAIDTIVGETSTILSSLLPSSSDSKAATSHLRATFAKASVLYFDLCLENSFYDVISYFSVSGSSIDDAVFEHDTCDDIEQKYEISIDNAGRELHEAEGRRIKGFVSPVVVKYGDGRGGGWDSGVVVISKAKVLL